MPLSLDIKGLVEHLTQQDRTTSQNPESRRVGFTFGNIDFIARDLKAVRDTEVDEMNEILKAHRFLILRTDLPSSPNSVFTIIESVVLNIPKGERYIIHTFNKDTEEYAPIETEEKPQLYKLKYITTDVTEKGANNKKASFEPIKSGAAPVMIINHVAAYLPDLSSPEPVGTPQQLIPAPQVNEKQKFVVNTIASDQIIDKYLLPRELTPGAIVMMQESDGTPINFSVLGKIQETPGRNRSELNNQDLFQIDPNSIVKSKDISPDHIFTLALSTYYEAMKTRKDVQLAMYIEDTILINPLTNTQLPIQVTKFAVIYSSKTSDNTSRVIIVPGSAPTPMTIISRW